MSLEHFQPWDNAEYAGLNRLIAQMNKGLFRNGSAFVDVNGANVSIPGGQVSGLTAAQIGGFTGAIYVTGSYTGTGTAGPSNPTSINLGFSPKIMLIASAAGTEQSIPWITGSATLTTKVGSSANLITLTVQTTSPFKFYDPRATSNPEVYAYAQLNSKGTIYRYLAFK